jgi:hypothetical protein
MIECVGTYLYVSRLNPRYFLFYTTISTSDIISISSVGGERQNILKYHKQTASSILNQFFPRQRIYRYASSRENQFRTQRAGFF